MHKDKKVALVTVAPSTGMLHVQTIIDSFYLPYGVKSANIDDIDHLLTLWYDSRCCLMGRSNYESVLAELGISSHAEMLRFSHMCSLTDCYWFKRANENIKWNDVSFHRNGFSSNLNEVLFYGSRIDINNYDSPDITTDGALPKTWRRERDGKFVLLKGYDKSDIEACYEIIANTVFTDLGIEHIPYWLETSNGITSSVCECIIKSDEEELVPAENLMRDYDCVGQPNFLPILREWGFCDEIDKMILGDCVIGNLDRHARNYGAIIDSETQQIKRFSPLYDQGGCYLSSNHGFLTYPPTGASFNKTIPTIPKELLRTVENISMTNIIRTLNNLPLEESHKSNIIDCLNKRIKAILAFCER